MSWPPDLTPVDGGRLVVIFPWELGALPRDWIEPLRTVPDEIWAPSTYVRDCLVVNGIDPEQIAVVPHGVNPLLFNRRAPAFALPTDKTFRFLFVGGTLPRKGADLVLEAYTRLFGPDDDVCLVVKDAGVGSFYRGQGVGDRIKALEADSAAPDVLYIPEDLATEAMPLVYRACQSLVAPYRAEGFALPILEAMACGLAVIATGHGACLDYCDDTVAMLLQATVVRGSEDRVAASRVSCARGGWSPIGRRSSGRCCRSSRPRRRCGARRAREQPRAVELDVGGCRRGGARTARRARVDHKECTAGHAAGPAQRLHHCPRRGELHRRLHRERRGVADEVVVVDTGSIDRTAEIAAVLEPPFIASSGETTSPLPATSRFGTRRATGCSCSTPTSARPGRARRDPPHRPHARSLRIHPRTLNTSKMGATRPSWSTRTSGSFRTATTCTTSAPTRTRTWSRGTGSTST